MSSFEPGQALSLWAPAKINLFLRVIGRRPDGYHDIKTRMQKLGLADHLTISLQNEGISLSCLGTVLPENETNLAFKAALSFCKYAGVSDGIKIVLEKKIPVAAGLGGGSSDAAAVLKGMNKLFNTGFGPDSLIDMARPLGADVPFFVIDFSAADATGIGDRLQEIQGLENFSVVLVNPGFPVSTKWVYENFALTTQGNPYMLAPGLYSDTESGMPPEGEDSSEFFNDLESVTISRYPEVGRIKEQLLTDGAGSALMSGSGPTVFGLFADSKKAEASFRKFRLSYFDVFLTGPY
ncbi:MAG: 4-(cytidine 5'-diphospho)-2-C-methyl-D-erythritol kinase [Desulfobulbaceae bacterium]|nr:4-(cytidine 5'-diphospho)-2-C-methyl-D-erythritol kinase [Desulfobulbaceae bacterium]MCK5545381.1 4-(cytidine 5'-diphospho)-2-C-methyl-D-erythritol kinase [Desulfobulbaceae bacterium]